MIRAGRVQRAWFAAIGVALVLGACGSPSPSAGDEGGPAGAAPRGGSATPSWSVPAPLTGLPEVTLVGPAELNAGETPTFEWAAVDGAATYQLSVLGPEGVRWAWEGSATRIRYGGDELAAGGPRLVVGSWWNVAAIGADGSILALSGMRPVSPGPEPGPSPAWVAGTAAPDAPAETVAPSEPVAELSPATTLACSLLSAAEIAAVIDGEWIGPAESIYPHGKGSVCEWALATNRYGGGVQLSISLPEAYNPEGWNGEWDPMLEGLGDEAYLTRSGMDRKVAWLHGPVSVMLGFDYGDPEAFETFVALARIVEERLDAAE